MSLGRRTRCSGGKNDLCQPGPNAFICAEETMAGDEQLGSSQLAASHARQNGCWLARQHESTHDESPKWLAQDCQSRRLRAAIHSSFACGCGPAEEQPARHNSRIVCIHSRLVPCCRKIGLLAASGRLREKIPIKIGARVRASWKPTEIPYPFFALMVAELGLGWACPPSHPGSSPVMRDHGRLFRELPLITRKAHEEKPSQADLDPFAHTPLASLAIHDWSLEMRRSAPYSVALGASQTQPVLTHRLLDQYNQPACWLVPFPSWFRCLVFLVTFLTRW
ncbi:hypothetical protein L1887_57748 [Cichorium endivia]|nr:hypothetical protein L1887_57748 [Cichorium endivia]